jgi:hypothetical protein
MFWPPVEVPTIQTDKHSLESSHSSTLHMRRGGSLHLCCTAAALQPVTWQAGLLAGAEMHLKVNVVCIYGHDTVWS